MLAFLFNILDLGESLSRELRNSESMTITSHHGAILDHMMWDQFAPLMHESNSNMLHLEISRDFS